MHHSIVPSHAVCWLASLLLGSTALFATEIDAASSLLKTLKSGTPKERRDAARSLGGKYSCGTVDALVEALVDSDPETVAVASRSLTSFGEKAAQRIAQKISADDAALAIQCCKILRALGVEGIAAKPSLIRLLSSDRAESRLASLCALQGAPQSSPFPDLLPLLRSETNVYVVLEAARLLRALPQSDDPSQTIETLVTLCGRVHLLDSESKTRGIFIQANELTARQAAPEFVAMQVQNHINLAAASIGAKGKPQLERVLRDNGRDNNERVAAILLIEAIGVHYRATQPTAKRMDVVAAMTPLLAEAVTDKSETVRYFTVKCLSRIGVVPTAELQQSVQGITKKGDESERLREAAQELLDQWRK